MLKTYNQIFKTIEGFAENHPQIKSYDLGTELQFDTKKIEDFAKLFVEVLPSTYNNPGVSVTLSFKIYDKVLTKNEKMYLNEVWSDTHQIALDLTFFLKQQGYMAQETTVTYNPQVYEHDNVLAGWQFSVDIGTEFELQCVRPYEMPDFQVNLDYTQGQYIESVDNISFNFDIQDLYIEMDISNLQTDGDPRTLLLLGAFPATIGINYVGHSREVSILSFAGAGFGSATSTAIPEEGGVLSFSVNQDNSMTIALDGVDITKESNTDFTGTLITSAKLQLLGDINNLNFTSGSISRFKFNDEIWDIEEGSGIDLTSNLGTVLRVYSEKYTVGLFAEFSELLGTGSGNFRGDKLIDIELEYSELILDSGPINYMYAFADDPQVNPDPREFTMNFNGSTMEITYYDQVNSGTLVYPFGSIANVPTEGVFRVTTEQSGSNEVLRLYHNGQELNNWVIDFDASGFDVQLIVRGRARAGGFDPGKQTMKCHRFKKNLDEWFFFDLGTTTSSKSYTLNSPQTLGSPGSNTLTKDPLNTDNLWSLK